MTKKKEPEQEAPAAEPKKMELVSVQPQPPSDTVIVALSGPFSVRKLRELNEDTPITSCPTNLDLTTEAGLAALYNMAGRPEGEIHPGEGVKLLLRYWLLIPDEVPEGETGALVPVTRTILTDGNGKYVNSTSEVLPKRLKQLLMTVRPERLAEGVPIEVFSRRSKRPGMHYHDIRLLTRDERVD